MIQIAETRDLQVCYALRHEVFVVEQGYPVDGEVDALDPESLHLLAHQDGKPVATARVYIHQGTAKIGRVCVLKSQRGLGLGSDLITAAISMASENNARRVVLGAQVHAVGFYVKLGFEPYGELYDDEGESHQMMERML